MTSKLRQDFPPFLISSNSEFTAMIKILEERLFPDDLDPSDRMHMKSEGYSWLYRPSHHIASGLITQQEIAELSEPGKRLLSIGAHPAFLERVLSELGLPEENMVIADKNPAILELKGDAEKQCFDMTEPWPEIGTFDVILFPESLCISLSNKIDQENPQEKGLNQEKFPNDAREAELLAFVLEESLKRLREGGLIRANGPMSHPNVVKKMSESLNAKSLKHHIDYDRYLLTVRTISSNPDRNQAPSEDR